MNEYPESLGKTFHPDIPTNLHWSYRVASKTLDNKVTKEQCHPEIGTILESILLMNNAYTHLTTQ